MSNIAASEFLPTTLPDFIDITVATWNEDCLAGRTPLPVLLMGAPGGGKSAVGRTLPRHPDLMFKPDFVWEGNLSQFDVPDVAGLPDLSGEVVDWKPPRWLRDACASESCFLQFEEAGDATEAMQNFKARLILDGELNGWKLPERRFIILNSNNTTDKSGAKRLTTKLGNRVAKFQLAPDVQAWLNYAKNKQLNEDIIAFITARPNMLFAFDADSQGTCPTPRSWEMAARFNPTMFKGKTNLYMLALQSCVGTNAALEVVQFTSIRKELPSIQSIIDNPMTALVPSGEKSTSAMYILATGLGRHMCYDNAGQILKYLYRLEPEFRIIALQDGLKLTKGKPNVDISSHPDIRAWKLSEGAKVLLEA